MGIRIIITDLNFVKILIYNRFELNRIPNRNKEIINGRVVLNRLWFRWFLNFKLSSQKGTQLSLQVHLELNKRFIFNKRKQKKGKEFNLIYINFHLFTKIINYLIK